MVARDAGALQIHGLERIFDWQSDGREKPVA